MRSILIPNRLKSLVFKAHQFLIRWISPVTIGVRAICTRDNRVLLVRHTYHPGWFLPGGAVDKGETLQEAIAREVHEETGVVAKEATFKGMFLSLHGGRSDHIALFTITDFELASQAAIHLGSEIAEVSFFALDTLPPDTSPASLRRIKEWQGGVDRSDKW